MNLLKIILLIADPVLVAFMVSVLIGVIFKDFAGKLLLKRALTFVMAIGYLLLYVYADGIWKNDIITYIVMFAPIAVLLVFIIIAIIFAPKGEVEKSEMDFRGETEKFVTGWDSMFPNDIDEYDKHKK